MMIRRAAEIVFVDVDLDAADLDATDRHGSFNDDEARASAASVTTGQLGYQPHRDPTPHRRFPRTAGEVKDAAGDERSELALDGDEDRATSTVAGGAHVAGGGRGPAPVVPVVSVPSETGGDKRGMDRVTRTAATNW
jgi:hypothetical protein